MKFTAEHEALRRTTRQFVENELNPFIPEWEEAGRFPIHDVFKKMGDLGLLGICKPEENGGLGLDYSYNLVVAEELGRAACGGVPLAIGVQTDMATPALARFGLLVRRRAKQGSAGTGLGAPRNGTQPAFGLSFLNFFVMQDARRRRQMRSLT